MAGKGYGIIKLIGAITFASLFYIAIMTHKLLHAYGLSWRHVLDLDARGLAAVMEASLHSLPLIVFIGVILSIVHWLATSEEEWY